MTITITAHSGLGYAFDSKRGCWCFIALDTKNPVGWPYETEWALLADLSRFAREMWGEFV